jgi:apolipoprotein N-acyltransferase
VLTGVVEPRTGLTPYVRAGNWPVVLIAMLGVAFTCSRAARYLAGGA